MSLCTYTTDPARHSGDIPRQVKTHDNTHAVAAFHYYRSVVFRIDDCDLCSVPIRIPGCARFTATPRHTSTPTTKSEVHKDRRTGNCGTEVKSSQVKSSLRYGTHVIRDNYVSPSSIVRHVCAQHDSASRELSLPLSHAGSIEVIMTTHESNSCSVSNAAGMPWALRVECRR